MNCFFLVFFHLLSSNTVDHGYQVLEGKTKEEYYNTKTIDN
jgi:hypothetical protein